jgi:Domain of unknown function (DUF4386)
MFLCHIAIGITSMVVFRKATGGAAEGTAATLASLAQHATTVRLTVLLTLLTFFVAVTLAVTLYALTRDQDHDLALLALCCRGTEAVIAPSWDYFLRGPVRYYVWIPMTVFEVALALWLLIKGVAGPQERRV